MIPKQDYSLHNQVIDYRTTRMNTLQNGSLYYDIIMTTTKLIVV